MTNSKAFKYWAAVGVATIYLLIIFHWFNVSIEGLQKLPANELGDFLAGTFAPLAFMFLILGYIQQGEELQQNTEALKLQADELRNSVEQQSHMVAVAQEELRLLKNESDLQKKRYERSLQPLFQIERSNGFITAENYDRAIFVLPLKNYGAEVRGLSIEVLTSSNTASNARVSKGRYIDVLLNYYQSNREAKVDLKLEVPYDTIMNLVNSSDGLHMQINYYDLENNKWYAEYALAFIQNTSLDGFVVDVGLVGIFEGIEY